MLTASSDSMVFHTPIQPEESYKASIFQEQTGKQIIPEILICEYETDSDLKIKPLYSSNNATTTTLQERSNTFADQSGFQPKEVSDSGWQTSIPLSQQTAQSHHQPRAQDSISDYKRMYEQQQMQMLQFQQYHNSRTLDSSRNLSTRPNLVRSLSDRNLQHLNSQYVESAPTNFSSLNFSQTPSFPQHTPRSQPRQSNAILQIDEATLISIILSLFDSTNCIYISDTDLDRHFKLSQDGKSLPWWHFANSFNDFIEQWLIPRAKGALGIAIAIKKNENGSIDRTRWIFKRGVVGSVGDEDVKLHKIHGLVEGGSEIKMTELAGLLHVAEEFDLFPTSQGFQNYVNVDSGGNSLETRIRTRFNATNNEFVDTCKAEIKQNHRNCCRIISGENSLKELRKVDSDASAQELVVIKFAKPQKLIPRTLPPLSTTPPPTTRSSSPATSLFNEFEEDITQKRWDGANLSTTSIFTGGRGARAVSLSALNTPAVISKLEVTEHPMRRRSDTDLSGEEIPTTSESLISTVNLSNLSQQPKFLERQINVSQQRVPSTTTGFIPQHTRTKSFPTISESGLSFFSHSAIQQQQQQTQYQIQQQLIQQQKQIQQLHQLQQLQQQLYTSGTNVSPADYILNSSQPMFPAASLYSYNLEIENQLVAIEKKRELLAHQMIQLQIGEE
ncbi:hypothetical protein HK098_004896 [Nowakowskiella sp. JEL0407]|nr:hypothetical protein HK098_004896 [Nowakowskiella sp. JEL0407]